MSRIEKEFNNRFKDRELPGKGFNSDGLWDSIHNELESKPKALPLTQSIYSKYNKLIAFAILSFLVIVALFTYNYFSKSTHTFTLHGETLTTENSNTTQKENLKSKSIQDEINATSSSSSEDNSERNSINLDSNEDQVNAELESPIQNNAFQKYLGEVDVDANGATNTTGVAIMDLDVEKQQFSTPLKTDFNSSPDNNFGTDNDYVKANLNVQKGISFKPSESTKLKSASINSEGIVSAQQSNLDNTFNKSSDELGFIQTLDFTTITSLSPEKAFDSDMRIDPVEVSNTDSDFQWQSGFYIGANLPQFKYSSTIQKEWGDMKNDSEQGLISLNYSFQTSVIIKNKWVLSTGLEYNDLRNRFNYEYIKDTTVLLTNQLISYQLNSDQDTINRVFIDTTVNASKVRTIEHFNHYKNITVPLEVGIQKEYKDWVFGFHAGATVQFNLSQTGRAFDLNSDLNTFESDTSSATLKPVLWGFRLSPTLGYRINENFTASVKASFNMHTSPFRKDDYKLHLMRPNFSVGIIYMH